MSPAAALYIFIICGLVPWASLKGARAIRADPSKFPGFARHVKLALFTQGFMLALALFTAHNLGLLGSLFPDPRVEPRFAGVGLLTLAVTLGTMPIRWMLAPVDVRRRLWMRMPHNAPQLAQWTLVALMAGFGEEVIYRGVLFQILDSRLHGWWPAALIASAAFSLAHVIQGWRAAAWIFAFSLGFHGLVWYCGNLYTAMVVHFLYDVLIGIIVGFWVRVPPAGAPSRVAGTSLPHEVGVNG